MSVTVTEGSAVMARGDGTHEEKWRDGASPRRARTEAHGGDDGGDVEADVTEAAGGTGMICGRMYKMERIKVFFVCLFVCFCLVLFCSFSSKRRCDTPFWRLRREKFGQSEFEKSEKCANFVCANRAAYSLL